MYNDEITLRPVTPCDEGLLRGWLTGPGGCWLELIVEDILNYYLRDEELARAYIVVVAGVNAGIVTVNREDLEAEKRIDIDHFLIQADLRGRGYGSRALRCLLEMTDWPQDVPTRTEIHPNNIRSIKCFSRAGFVAFPCDSEDYRANGTVCMEHRRSG